MFLCKTCKKIYYDGYLNGHKVDDHDIVDLGYSNTNELDKLMSDRGMLDVSQMTASELLIIISKITTITIKRR